MKRDSEEEGNPPRRYMSTTLPEVLRTSFGALGVAWKKRGWSATDFRKFLSEAGYDVPEPSLRRWASKYESRGSAMSAGGHPGRTAKLTLEQHRLLVGFVLDRNEKNFEVHIATAGEFILNTFGVHLSTTSVGTYLHSSGFSCRVAAACGSGYSYDRDQLCSLALTWIDDQRESGVLNTPRQLLCSIDFTFTGHRTDRQTTFASTGNSQPHEYKDISSFTNCMVTCVWADGVNRTPPQALHLQSRFENRSKTH